MKTSLFIRKMCLFLLPFILYAILFVAFEPYNYWGLKPEADYDTTAFARLLDYKHNPSPNILLGDSRFAHLNIETEEAGDDRYYAKLGYGGQNLPEQIQTFWYAVEMEKLDSVIMGISFYRFIRPSHNRIKTLFPYLDDSNRYVTSFSYHQEMIENLRQKVFSTLTVLPAVNTPEKDFDGYAQIIYDVCKAGAFQSEYMDELIEIARFCKNNSIEIYFVTPPMHHSIWNLVIEPLKLESLLDEYKSTLSQYAIIYDMEYPECLFTTDYADVFSDGFHLQDEEVLATVIKDKDPLFGRIWEGGSILYT